MKDALRAYRKRARIGLALSLFALALFAVLANVVASNAARLEREGIRVDGEVLTVDQKTDGVGRMVVSFTHGGAVRATTVHLDSSSPDYERGQPVTVLIDPDDPEHVSVPGETNQSPVTEFPMVLLVAGGLVRTIVSVGGLARAGRQERILKTNVWRRRSGRYGELPPRWWMPVPYNARSLLLIEDDAGRDVVLSLTNGPASRGEIRGFEDATEFDVAGPVRGYCVIRGPSSGRPISARPPSTSRAERRWRKVFES